MIAELYTFVLDVNGGTYVSQFSEDDLRRAVLLWAQNADEDIISAFGLDSAGALLDAVSDSICDADMGLVVLSGLRSAWFMYVSVNNVGGNLNIIKTAG